ncbi:formyl transferase-like protein [Pseudomonas sp. SJZ080]|uniref:formyltransferase family protein n=1 Tax=Pseudomonas sp. SJZ080 TaxID=2572888 RepID=UPI001199F886|nr:formyltransferase family protein [Pseudomonas sp. SJZ080]TWC57219.1 formyl transferase-like protein [Pseudomonas sp. SJZ080]
MKGSVELVSQVASPRLKILFLGYAPDQTSLISELAEANCEIWHTDKIIESTEGFELVVSYGYRHILKKNVINSSSAPIINLHISYLPWNRGAHPNFWSFFDSTPSGVSIHLIDEGVDTGPIIYQRYVNFTKNETSFSKTYKRLVAEIELLFKENIEEIISLGFTAVPQRRRGTYHRVSDLPIDFAGWDSEIQTEVVRLDRRLGVSEKL